jgi:hypothetical protein
MWMGVSGCGDTTPTALDRLGDEDYSLLAHTTEDEITVKNRYAARYVLWKPWALNVHKLPLMPDLYSMAIFPNANAMHQITRKTTTHDV